MLTVIFFFVVAAIESRTISSTAAVGKFNEICLLHPERLPWQIATAKTIGITNPLLNSPAIIAWDILLRR